MGPLLGPLVYLYMGHLYIYIWAIYGGLIVYLFISVYMGVYIYGPTMGGPIVFIWVWFFINKNMIKIEK